MPDDVTTPAASPAPPAVVAAPAVEAAPVAEAAAAPESPAFAWDAWDGKVEAVPEPYREIATHVSGHYGKKLTEAEADRDRLKVWYDGFFDPQAAEAAGMTAKQMQDLRTEIETLRASSSEVGPLKTRAETAEQKLIEIEKHQDSLADEDAKEFVATFKVTYKDVLEDPHKQKVFGALIQPRGEKETPATTAAEVVRLGIDAVESFLGLRDEFGDKAAFEIVKRDMALKGHVPAPNAGASLVAGASPTRMPAAAPAGTADEPKSLDDLFNRVVNKANASLSGQFH
jgi:hypothetical protein